MTTPVALTLLGFGLGALFLRQPATRRAGEGRADPRATLRDRAIEAQKFSAHASQYARDVSAQWRAEEETQLHGPSRTEIL